ncbi:MAG: hypothetical protein AUG16_04010 [Thaumarchaeota archaeon 13_1_20CM_2_39_20]|nr:MAG: hypothetical protein AUG16_04010 [Thaumarchaeota archaeon 13_1_20CM_2_39_20]
MIITAEAEPIMITVSSTMNKVIFDGKWTYGTEWKQSSLNTISYNDGTLMQLRTAHQENFIYVLIDEVSKTSFDKHADIAVICFDKNGNQSAVANENDYCFGVPFDSKNPFTLRGGSLLEQSNHYTKIKNSNELIGISNVSDENDRYTAVPHASYEFRIPTDLVGRSDVYGFYMAVYDAHSNKVYAWPDSLTIPGPLKIPSPSKWGQIISPDKSLPEFPLPFLAFLISMVSLVYFSRKHFFLMLT